MRAFAFLSTLVCWSCAAPPARMPDARPSGHVLNEAEAVGRAEEFVRVNGYGRTEDADPRRVQVERGLTFGSTPAELLPLRAGTLLPRACGILPEAVRTFDRGWSILFCYNPAHPIWREGNAAWKDSVRHRSRVVVMNASGTDAFIAHQDFGLHGPKIKRLSGMDDLERLLQPAAQPGVRPAGPSARGSAP